MTDRNVDNRDFDRSYDRDRGYNQDYYREVGGRDAGNYERNWNRDREWSRDRNFRDVNRGTQMGGWSSSPSSFQGYQGYNDTDFGDGDTGHYRDRNYHQRTDWDRGDYHRDHETFGDRVRRFFGKGPKGYKRSDERIREDVCDRLSEGWIDASDIEINVQDGEVTLSGYVDERRMKHVAEDLAERVAGVQDVHNHLRVRKQSMQDTRSTMSSGTTSREREGTVTHGNNGKKKDVTP